MPNKFLLKEYKEEAAERESIKLFDAQMKGIKIPKMLLERLKKEFDENYKLSVRSNIENNKSSN